jgi:uncharacterized OsmC-like protein
MATKTKTTINGVNTEELFKTIDSIKATPGIAKFKFRVNNEWLGCGHNRTTVKDFHGAFEDIDHEQTFVLDCDEPPLLLGQDKGANPVEHLLNALAGCVTSGIVHHAAARGIEIQEIESSIEGDIDLHGFLGIDPNVRNGYQGIRMNFRIKADGLSDEEINEIVNFGPSFSPVYNTVSEGTKIEVKAERM